MADLIVEAINRERREVLLRADDGMVLTGQVILPITGFLDADGDETDDLAEAVVAIFGRDGVGWSTLLLADYPPGRLN